jgi:glucose-1-phosphate thymidylyltransferase
LQGAYIFGYKVKNPQDYGVVRFNNLGNIIEVIEKPQSVISNVAVPGLYFYSNDVCKKAQEISPSRRGEIEITELNNAYAAENRLQYTELGRGTFWIDTGTFESLQSAAQFISIVQERQGLKVGSPEEVALNNGWIDVREYREMASLFLNSGYLRNHPE